MFPPWVNVLAAKLNRSNGFQYDRILHSENCLARV